MIVLHEGSDIKVGDKLVYFGRVNEVVSIGPYKPEYRILTFDNYTTMTVADHDSFRDRGDGVLCFPHQYMAEKL